MRHVAPQREKALSEPVLLILLSLAQKPLHGYAILQEIAKLSQGRVRMSTGTLYGAIQRLLTSEWIERHDQADTSRDKQAYRLTRAGREQLQGELDRLDQLMRAARIRLKVRAT
jgi:DNA-binding PadR family transcriptional regulator